MAIKINFSIVLLDLKNKPIKETDKEGSPDATLGYIAAGALLAATNPQENVSGAEKARQFKLAMKLCDGGDQELTADEITSLKSLIARNFTPLIVGRAFELLDPEPESAKKVS